MPSMDDEKWKDDMLAALKTIKGKMGYVRTLAKDELENIQCGFVLSTAKHAVPVTKINEIEYPQHPLINEIQKMFKDEVNKERS